MKPIGAGRKLPALFSLMRELLKMLFAAMVPGLASVLVAWVRAKLLKVPRIRLRKKKAKAD